ncbi:MAG: hypothetical protein PHC94_05545 [Methylobacter sp.]|nr:hypothetical protein [Methylobacter sp.]
MNVITNNERLISIMQATFPKGRPKLIEWLKQNPITKRKLRLIFHEAEHATAIYLNNKARMLPPVFFLISLNAISNLSENNFKFDQASHSFMEGGRLIESLPPSIKALVDQSVNPMAFTKEYMSVLEADIINLLMGPLAEAKHVAEIDNQPFNRRLVNLQALKNYGGSSKLAVVEDYLQSFSTSQQERDRKLDALYTVAFKFLNGHENWAAIAKLANHIVNNDQNSIRYEDVASVLEP